jgi:arsenical pump membrane protein
MSAALTTWVIAGLTATGVILRPFALPEAVWAVAGAALLVALRLISPGEALAGIARGSDVYLFLAGMMLLAETARAAGLFDWLAALATRHAKGSGLRLFLLIYGVGTLVTIFLSNDATAVVLTPAVAAAVRTAQAKEPLPYLLVCAFIANAASFVLPISNPANLVIYGAQMPPLWRWLAQYLAPSAASIIATCLALRWTQRRALAAAIGGRVPLPLLSASGQLAALGIAATAVALLAASAIGVRLGLPTAIAGLLTAISVLFGERRPPWRLLRGISWGVLPMVAGLFVVVAALDGTGLIAMLRILLHQAAAYSVAGTAAGAGIGVALASNLVNNLPVALVAGSALRAGQMPDPVIRSVLIGADLGPNLSVTGSLATILWLAALRREVLPLGALKFLKLGAIVMPPALLIAIAAALLAG